MAEFTGTVYSTIMTLSCFFSLFLCSYSREIWTTIHRYWGQWNPSWHALLEFIQTGVHQQAWGWDWSFWAVSLKVGLYTVSLSLFLFLILSLILFLYLSMSLSFSFLISYFLCKSKQISDKLKVFKKKIKQLKITMCGPSSWRNKYRCCSNKLEWIQSRG